MDTTRLQRLVEQDAACKTLVKHVASVSCAELHPDERFTEALMELGAAEGEGSVHGAELLKFAVLSRELSKVRRAFHDSVSSMVQMPFSATMSGSHPTELKAALDKAVRHYEKERGRRKGSPERKQAALETLQRLLQRAAADYVTDMVAVQEKRDVALVRQLVLLFKEQRRCLEASLAVMDEHLPALDQLLARVDQVKTQVDASKAGMASLHRAVKEAVYASERKEQEVDRLERESKGGGKRHRRRASNGGLAEIAAGEALLPGAASRSRELQAFLDDVVKGAGNEACADCGFNQLAFAASDLGILLCAECAAIHKNPGVPVKVGPPQSQSPPVLFSPLPLLGHDWVSTTRSLPV